MALKKTVVTPHGFDAVDAYHRVEDVHIKGKSMMSFKLRSYRIPDGPHFADEEMEAVYSLSGDNPIAQAYEYLKTMHEFADAVDC